MNIVTVIILTLVIYSIITTVIAEIAYAHENEDVVNLCAYGIAGCSLMLALYIIYRIKYFKFHYNKRSIFTDENGNKFACHTKDTNDVVWNPNYLLVKRYADKSEWVGLPLISDDALEKCRINCNHCKFNDCCVNDAGTGSRCKHNDLGGIIEFDKFEKK